MKYRVINKKTGDDITDDYWWVLRPDGDLYFIDDHMYSCTIPDAEVVRLPYEIDQSIFDAGKIKMQKVTNPFG